MIGGSSASYLAHTPCVPLFCTLFNKGGNRRAFRLPRAGGGSFHCSVDPSPGHIRCRRNITYAKELSGVEKLTRSSLKGFLNRPLFAYKNGRFASRTFISLEKGKLVFQKFLSETPFKPDRVSFCTLKNWWGINFQKYFKESRAKKEPQSQKPA